MAKWFSDARIYELTTPVAKRIIRSIHEKNIQDAVALCDLLRDERIILHDFFADACTALYTWIGRNLGEEQLHDMFIFSFDQSARRQIYDVVDTSLKRGVEVFILARGGWVSHSCSGAGEHGGAFRLEEDDEKFTFILDPCGSGGRLWRKGRYGPPCEFAHTETSHSWSYNRKEFPYYCVHCSFLNETLPYKYLGYINWPVDPPDDAMDVCRWYLYKDRYAVPKKYYDRFGLTKLKSDKSYRIDTKRWFSKEQLAEMVKPTPDRILEMLHHGHYREAARIASKMGGEFFFLHNLYVNMLVTTLDFIANKAGEDGLGKALGYVYDKCIKSQITALIDELPPREVLAFLIWNIFLAGTCGGAGFPPSKISVEENDVEVRITLSPCASGGKLIHHRAYEPLHATVKFRERLENSLLHLSLKMPLPRMALELSTPIVFDYLSEFRKPEGLGMTGKAYPWTGEYHSLPYYCCFCTSFLKETGYDWLQVKPPGSLREPCVWRAMK